MGKPLTDDERQAIADDLNGGKSVHQTAKDHSRSSSTISKVAKQFAIDVSANAHSRLARAHEARRAYGAEARAERVAIAHERMMRILERMGQPHIKYHFGGKDNTRNEVALDEPDSEMLRQYASAYSSLSRAESDTLRHDERSDDVDRASGLIVDLVASLKDSR